MSSQELGVLIAVVTAIVLLVTGSAFVFFARFLKKERESAERFREIHLKRPADEE